MPTTQKISHKFVGVATILLMTNVSILHADETVWQEIPQQTNTAVSTNTVRSAVSSAVSSTSTSAALTSKLEKYRLLVLDEERIKSQLLLTGTADSAIPGITISLPLPDGTFATVEATPINMLGSDFAKEMPDFRTWNVTGTDGKVVSGIIDISNAGFHAMLDLANGDTIFIDPNAKNGKRQYAAFSKITNAKAFKQSWSEGAFRQLPTTAARAAVAPAVAAAPSAPGSQIRHYRLAIAATAGYTTMVGGRNQSTAKAKIAATIARVNYVMRRDLSIQLDLKSAAIFTGTENNYPFRGLTNTTGAFAGQGVNALASAGIQATAYDIGHVFGAGSSEPGGGVSVSLGTVCTSSKANAYSGNASFSTPEVFGITMVAHEMGHQLGADHTFDAGGNNICGQQRTVATSVEPGLGSTIMSYSYATAPAPAGCGHTGLPTNIAGNHDMLYHSMSIDQIRTFAHIKGNGTTCGTLENIANQSPIPWADRKFTIPTGTPFLLSERNWVDPDGNGLTYSWEQIDTDSKAGSLGVDDGVGALIRVAKADTNGNVSFRTERSIPPINVLLKRNPTSNDTALLGEQVPRTQRTLTFGLTGRDNKGGTTYIKAATLTVKNTGEAFRITQPTTTVLKPNTKINVAWRIAGTDQAIFNCPTLDVEATNNGGASFMRLATTPNKGANGLGQTTVTLPASINASLPTNIRLKCSNDASGNPTNLFFAVSAQNPFIIAR